MRCSVHVSGTKIQLLEPFPKKKGKKLKKKKEQNIIYFFRFLYNFLFGSCHGRQIHKTIENFVYLDYYIYEI